MIEKKRRIRKVDLEQKQREGETQIKKRMKEQGEKVDSEEKERRIVERQIQKRKEGEKEKGRSR